MTEKSKKPHTVTTFIKELADPADLKGRLAITIAIITTVWTLLGIQGAVRELDPKVGELRQQVTDVERDAAVSDRRLDRISAEIDALRRSRRELNDIIRKAVSRGISEGVSKALKGLNR